MKRVLFIQPSLNAVGGIEKVVPTVASGLADAGYAVFATTFYDEIPTEQTFWSGRFEGNETLTFGLWRKLVKIWRRARRIRQVIKEADIDYVVVSAQGAIVTVLLLRAFRLIKVPVIAYIHEARSDGGRWYRWLTGVFYPMADGWIGVSAGICDEIKRLPGMSKKKVVLAYNAVAETPISQEALVEAERMTAELPRPIFINAGRFELTKGSDVLVKSFLDYAVNHQGTLLMLGTGSLESELKATVRRANFQSRVRFLGRVDHPLAYMARSDLYVSGARSEPFGLALVEALSVGLPVVATDVPSGPSEILSPNVIPRQYPFRAAYGVLMAPPQKDISANTRSFAEAVELALRTSYDAELLKGRARAFSRHEQLTAIKDLLETARFKRI